MIKLVTMIFETVPGTRPFDTLTMREKSRISSFYWNPLGAPAKFPLKNFELWQQA